MKSYNAELCCKKAAAVHCMSRLAESSVTISDDHLIGDKGRDEYDR